ncbi:alpha-L-fucosidase [Adhaeribacter pallidiroseus]|uniref:alpha-L-fucosidase n=1 Tax=Adhaeribacter pallidiroseus TaxID=2072847 RepID=A0A369QCE3_9BACT|nr:alpha-L-fucosidase [Adhaeribacter pallidiroseus]RDC62563.1 Alpha-L-fucosidase [Adhaeribacter pallidiroseus]
MRYILSCLLVITCLLKSWGQQHNTSQTYVVPTDPQVQAKLATWQDLKFGLFMHWGTYSQWGIVESWSICPEDEGWTQRKGPYAADYNTYKKAYENIRTEFNPVQFNPEKWVAAAKTAGMKYMVFTTKHHDGFAMFDTKESDYKITDSKSAFAANPRSNITKEVFNAFRKENFLIGTYFSKPDWHNENYWWPYFPPKDRNVNYDPAKYPERWQKFKNFTYNQISELMTGYGPVDILWLDGGWVRPKNTIDSSVDWQKAITYEQDVDMARIAKMAREKQPGLIVVDRTVAGEFENYTTPEHTVPDKPLNHPWETCMTMGDSWSYVPNDTYKTTNQLIQLLVKIVSRGGNFLLNIGPSPKGDWAPEAYSRLAQIGDWMQINGEGIYNSRAVAPYEFKNIYYTRSKDQNTIYAFYLSDKEQVNLPATLEIPLPNITQVKKVSLLGQPEKLKWQYQGKSLRVQLSGKLQNKADLKQAATFKIEY